MVVSDGRGRWYFPGTDVLAPELNACPLRYVLDDAVVAVCAELAFEDDTILGSSLELLRVPAPKLWVEFRRGARNSALADVERLASDAEQDAAQRIGLLVIADERGRSGSIHVCWERDGLSPELAPFVIEYDFDDDTFSKSAHQDGACLGAVISDFPAIQALYNRVRFRLSPEWQRYYDEKATSPAHYQSLLTAAVRPLLEDVPFFALFCLLLASGGALRQVSVDRRRLNAARARRTRMPLLDHVEVTMTMAAGASISAAPGDSTRSPPRLHFVRGHLVRRGGGIHWRTAHMRGSAASQPIRTRTVTLTFAAARHAERSVAQGNMDSLSVP